MKRTLFNVIVCVFGAAVLIGGSVFAALMHDYHTVHFDRYRTEYYYAVFDEDSVVDGVRVQYVANQRIKFPQYYLYYSDVEEQKSRSDYDPNPALADCYDEIDCACLDYAEQIAYKYRDNVDLDFTVDITKDRLTIKFTGTGYPENGEPEPLSRTYIFDIDGVGADKLPRLINRAEFVGY